MSGALIDIRMRSLGIPFAVAFRHASAERTETATAWVVARTERAAGFGESCPRPYVTEEDVDTVRAFCDAHVASVQAHVRDVSTLRAWMRTHRREIDRNPAAWCAIELAVLDALARDAGVSVEALIGLPPLAGSFRYSAVIGDMSPPAFAAMMERYRRFGFLDFKIKLSGDPERDRSKVETVHTVVTQGLRLRADANNLWDDAATAISYLRELNGRFWALEEPIAAGRYGDLARIGEALDCRIVLDESLLRVDQLDALPGAGDRWVTNVRVSKMGGLLRSLDIVAAARERNVGVIVGAQVGETSLLTRAALIVSRAAGSYLQAQEGAFGTELLQYDVVERPLMFGPGGVLDVARSGIGSVGFGLEVQDQFR